MYLNFKRGNDNGTKHIQFVRKQNNEILYHNLQEKTKGNFSAILDRIVCDLNQKWVPCNTEKLDDKSQNQVLDTSGYSLESSAIKEVPKQQI